MAAMPRTPDADPNAGPAADRSLTPLTASPPPDPLARAALDAAMWLLELAERRGGAVELAQALTQVGHALVCLRAMDAAERYFAQALRHAAMLGAADARVDLLCTLAELACTQAHAAAAADGDPMAARRARDRARDRAFQAAALAGQVTDAQWEMRVLLRIGDVLEACGDHDDAVAMQARAIELMGLGAGAPPFERGDSQMLTAPAQLM